MNNISGCHRHGDPGLMCLINIFWGYLVLAVPVALCLCPGFPGTADLENVSRHGGLAAPGAHHTPAADEASSRELLRRVAELPLMLNCCMRNRWRKRKEERAHGNMFYNIKHV